MSRPSPRSALPGRNSSPAAASPLPRPVEAAKAARAWPALLAASAAFAITFLAFIPALQGEFLDWDDKGNFLDNPHFRGIGSDQLRWMFTTFHMGHYQPLTWLSLGIDYTLWGMNPRGYHLTNILLHAANAALLCILAMRLIALARRRSSPGSLHGSTALSRRATGLPIMLGSLVAALLFAVHPLRVESVAWITERRDLLSAFFMLLTVLAWLRAALARGSERALMLVAAWILFLCAAASKVIVVTLPPVLLVLDWYPLGRIGRATPAAAAARPSWSPAWLGREAIVAGLEKAPLFAASLVFGLLASVFQHRHEWLYTLEVHPLAGRLAQACYGLVFYFGKTVWPSTLIPIYEIRLPINPLEARFALSAAAVAVAATLLVALRRRAPALGAAALAYLIFLAPVSGLMQNGPQIAADRYTYLPLMGFAILAGGLAAAAWSSPHTPRGARVGLAILAAGVVALLASLSWQQCRIWRTTSTLWAYAAAAAPESSVARNSHGYMLLVQGRYDEALSHLREAVRLQPANLTAHENIWILLRRRGDGPEARIAGYRESLRILPEYTDAEYQLGKALVEQEQYAEAVGHLRTVLARKSGHVNAHLALAIALMKQGDWDGSIRHNELAVLADPNNAQARFNLAEVLRVVGRDEDAIFHLGEVLRIEPNHAQARQRLDRLLNPQSPGAASPGSPGSP